MSGAERYRYSSRRETYASSSGRRETLHRSRDSLRGGSEYRHRDRGTRSPATQRATESYRSQRFSDALDRKNKRTFNHGHIPKEKEKSRVKRGSLSAGQDLRRKIERGKSKDGVLDDARRKSLSRNSRDNRSFLNVGEGERRAKPFNSSAPAFGVLSDNDEDVRRYRRLEADYLKYFYQRDDIEKVLSKDSTHYKVDKEEMGRLSRLLDTVLQELEEQAQIIKRKLESVESIEGSGRGQRDVERNISVEGETAELGSSEPKEHDTLMVPSQSSSLSSVVAQSDLEEIEVGEVRNLTTKEANEVAGVVHSNDEEEKAELKDLQGCQPSAESEDHSEDGQDLREKLRKGRLVRKFQEELERLDPDLREEVISAVTGTKPRSKSFESSESNEKLVITVSQVPDEGRSLPDNEPDIQSDTSDLPLAISAAAAKQDLETCSGDALGSLEVENVKDLEDVKDLDVDEERWNRSVRQGDAFASKSYLKVQRTSNDDNMETSELDNGKCYGNQTVVRQTRHSTQRWEEELRESMRESGRSGSRKRLYSGSKSHRQSAKTKNETPRSMQGKSKIKSQREYLERKTEKARSRRVKEIRISKTHVNTGSKSRGHSGNGKRRPSEGKHGLQEFVSQDSDLYFKKFLSLVGDHAGLSSFSKPSSVSSHIVAPTSNYATSVATLVSSQQLANQGTHPSTGNTQVFTHHAVPPQLATAMATSSSTGNLQVFTHQAFPPQLAMARPAPPSSSRTQVFSQQTFPPQVATPMPTISNTGSTQVFAHPAIAPQIARPLPTPPSGVVTPVPLLTQPVHQLPRPLFPSNPMRPLLPMVSPSVRIPHEMMHQLSGQAIPANSASLPRPFFPNPVVRPPALATVRLNLVHPGNSIPVLSGALSRRNTEAAKEKKEATEKGEQGVVHANLAQVPTKNVGANSTKEDKKEEIQSVKGYNINADVLMAKLKRYSVISSLGVPGSTFSVLTNKEAFVGPTSKDAVKDMGIVKKSILKQPTKQFKERPDELIVSVDQKLLPSSQKRNEFLELSSSAIKNAEGPDHSLREREDSITKESSATDVSVFDKNIGTLKRTSDALYSMIQVSDKKDFPASEMRHVQDLDHSIAGEKIKSDSLDTFILRAGRTGVKEYEFLRGRRHESTVSTSNHPSTAFAENSSARDNELLWQTNPTAPYQYVVPWNSSKTATEINVKSEPGAGAPDVNLRNNESANRAAVPYSYSSGLLHYDIAHQPKETATSIRKSLGATFSDGRHSPSGIDGAELKRRKPLLSTAVPSRDAEARNYPIGEDNVYTEVIKRERFDYFDDKNEAQEAPGERSEDYLGKWEARSYSTSFDDIPERNRDFVSLKPEEEELDCGDDYDFPRYCDLCDIGFSTSFSAKFHLSTEKHALAVRRQRMNVQTRTNRTDDRNLQDHEISTPYGKVKGPQGDQGSTSYIGRTNKGDDNEAYVLPRSYAMDTDQGPANIRHYASAAPVNATKSSYGMAQADHSMDLPVSMVSKGPTGSSLRTSGNSSYSTPQSLMSLDFELMTKDYRTSSRW